MSATQATAARAMTPIITTRPRRHTRGSTDRPPWSGTRRRTHRARRRTNSGRTRGTLAPVPRPVPGGEGAGPPAGSFRAVRLRHVEKPRPRQQPDLGGVLLAEEATGERLALGGGHGVALLGLVLADRLDQFGL